MPNRSDIDFLVYENQNIGSGHLKRSSILFKYLKNFYNCKFYLNKLPNYKKKNNLKKVLILDSHYPNETLIKNLKKNYYIIGLDYFGKIKIDMNILVHNHKKTFQKKLFVGKKYILLDKEKLLEVKNIKQEINTALIFFGMANKKKISMNFAIPLLKKGFKKVLLIIGKFNKEKIFNLNKNQNLIIKKSPKNFLQLLAKSQVVFVNSGNTLFEAMYLKKKIWSIPQTIFEKNIFNNLFKAKELNYSLICKMNKKMILSSPKYKKINFNGEFHIKKLIDQYFK